LKISIHQPAYLPWLGYFDKIRQSDVFVYLDTVQYQKNSFQNRNKIRTQQGSSWLTVPVKTKGVLFNRSLSELAINTSVPWQKKHLRAIEMNYTRSSQFHRVMEWLGPFYSQEWLGLSDLCFAMLIKMVEKLGIKTKIVKASELDYDVGVKSDLVLNICKCIGAETYLSGSLGRDYLDVDGFERIGMSVDFQDYQHPEYTQVYEGFEPYMAMIDLMMCEKYPERIY
tara:strand:- start:53531 stop:54208 length:678 start_codon:yes stop_codon:yes gene_type:complete